MTSKLANGRRGSAMRLLGRLGAICAVLMACTAPSLGQADEAPADAALGAPSAMDGSAYPVDRFVPRYPGEADRVYGLMRLDDHPGLPDLADLADLVVELGVTEDGYIAPRPGVPTTMLRLGDLDGGEPQMFYDSALNTIASAIVEHFNESERIIGVYVAFDPQDIDVDRGNDLRPPDDSSLRYLVVVGIVTELRTLASGERIDPETRINHPHHARIRLRSPIRPFDTRNDPPDETPADDDEPEDEAEEEQVERRDILRRDELNAFMYRLGRHPGRRVDASLGPGQVPGGVALDYIVSENKPMLFYAQTSNTGTKQTGRWRQRFGFMHSQLTNNDDILNIEYVTTNFEDVHGVSASYEAPIGDSEYLRWRAYGSFSQYTASEIGLFDDEFKGRSWIFGGAVTYNIFQKDELFIDAVAGVRYADYKVDNRAVQIVGEEDFIFPHIGLVLERETDWYRTNGQVTLEYQNSSLSGVDETELNQLGRLAPDTSWLALQWDLSHSFFLEPVFDPQAMRAPDPDRTYTLAHEVALGFRGQYAFGDRLIPQAEQVMGGMYSVRGYPESIVAGDTTLIGNVEYRFHVPRAFGVEAEPGELFGQPFRFAPQYTYGRPDWDLVLRGFLDVGRSEVHDAFFFESSETLIGAGIGLEFVFKRNFSARVDWGFALKSIDRLDVDSGDNRVHFAATLAY